MSQQMSHIPSQNQKPRENLCISSSSLSSTDVDTRFTRSVISGIKTEGQEWRGALSLLSHNVFRMLAPSQAHPRCSSHITIKSMGTCFDGGSAFHLQMHHPKKRF